MDTDESKLPASARPIATATGRTANLHYTKAHIERIRAAIRAGNPVKLPEGYTMDGPPVRQEPAAAPAALDTPAPPADE